jgi:hypothetical protein
MPCSKSRLKSELSPVRSETSSSQAVPGAVTKRLRPTAAVPLERKAVSKRVHSSDKQNWRSSKQNASRQASPYRCTTSFWPAVPRAQKPSV